MNLLPEYYKRNLQLEAWRRFLIFFGTYLGIVGIISVMLLLPSYFFLQFQIGILETQLKSTQSSESYRKTQQGDRNVKAANSMVGVLVGFESAKPNIVVILDDLLGRVLPGVVLSSFSYAEKPDGTAQVQISGTATQRDIYISFIENVRKSRFVQTAINPSAEELKKETNIAFNLSFIISSVGK
ncbi:MAG: hypothetical protein AAB482_03090 [Patescibacteria group bacterium]